MPDIPSDLPEQSLSVGPSAGLSPVATPGAFGAQVGDAIGTMGEVSDKLHHDAFMRANQAAVTEAYNKLNEWETQALHDPQNGVLNKNLGKDAPPVVDKTLVNYQDTLSKINSGFTNDQQRESFARMAAEHHNSVTRQLYAYEHHQVTGYANEQSDAFIKNQQTSAIQQAATKAPGSAEQIVNSIEMQKAAIQDAGERNGLPPETIKAQQDAVASATHMGVMRQFSDADDHPSAQAWFDAHKQELTGNDLNEATRLMQAGKTKSDGRDLADSIVNAPRKEGVQPNLEDDLATLEGKKIEDTAVHDDAQRRIVMHYDLANKAHNERQQQILSTATDAIEQDPNHEIPPTLAAQMDYKSHKAALLYRDKLIAEGQPKTDVSTYLDIQTKLGNPESWKENFGDGKTAGSFDLNHYKANLSTADFKKVSDEIKATQVKVQNRDNTLSQGQVATQVTQNLFEANKLAMKGKPDSPTNVHLADLQGRFLVQLHRAVGAQQLEKQRELTPEEVSDTAKKLMATTTWQAPRDSGYLNVTRLFSNTKEVTGHAFEKPGADKMAYSVRDIPKADLDLMDQSDKRNGYRRTDAQRIQDYNHRVMTPPATTTKTGNVTGVPWMP